MSRDSATTSFASSYDIVPPSISSSLLARRFEYTRTHHLRIKTATWNVAALPNTADELASWFADDAVDGHRIERLETHPREESIPALAPDHRIGLYVLGLQEVVDLSIVGRRVYGEAEPLDKWSAALAKAVPSGYELVAQEQMSGLLLLAFAAPELRPRISHVSTAQVGTGLLGYMGNKGAVAVRLVLGEATRLVFVTCHLASGSEQASLERRCWDFAQIQSRLAFQPVPGLGRDPTISEKLGDEDAVILMGDLNFRLASLPGHDIRRLLSLHIQGDYGKLETHTDETDETGDVGDVDHESETNDSGHGPREPRRERSISTATADLFVVKSGDSDDDDDDDTIASSPAPPKSSSASQAEQASSHDTIQNDTIQNDTIQNDGGLKVNDKNDENDDNDAKNNENDNDSDNDSYSIPYDPNYDPTSLQSTLNSLLPHDQLQHVMRERKAFHDGWREGPVTFLPTYKYDVGSVGQYDTSEKQRAPSWCDRILFRTQTDYARHLDQERERERRRRREREWEKRMSQWSRDDPILFDYDPNESMKSGITSASARPPSSSSSASSPVAAYSEEDAPKGTRAHNYDGSYDGGYNDGGYNDDDDEDGLVVITEDVLPDALQLENYTSYQEVTSSDHKPVAAQFLFYYDGVVPELKSKVHAEITRHLDRTENENRPMITLVIDPTADRDPDDDDRAPERSNDSMSFGKLSFHQAKSRSLTIANTGRVPATVSFVDREETDRSQWVTPRFFPTDLAATDDGGGGGSSASLDRENRVTLAPGDTVGVIVEAAVTTTRLAQQLNHGQTTLDEIFILRTEGGRDCFLRARAQWLPSCIGRSLEELIRVPRPLGTRTESQTLSRIQKESQSQSQSQSQSSQSQSRSQTPRGIRGYCESMEHKAIPPTAPVQHAAPVELVKLTEALEAAAERAMADEGMVAKEVMSVPKEDFGWPFADSSWSWKPCEARRNVTQRVLEAVDTDQDIASCFGVEVTSVQRLEVIADVFQLFLRGLTEGIITPTIWPALEAASTTSVFADEAWKSSSSSAKGGLRSLSTSPEAVEDSKASVLDVLAAHPHHNIAFVFATAAIARVCAEIAPLPREDVRRAQALAASRVSSPLTPRMLSLRRKSTASEADVRAEAAVAQRRSRERRFAETLAPLLCRWEAAAGSLGGTGDGASGGQHEDGRERRRESMRDSRGSKRDSTSSSGDPPESNPREGHAKRPSADSTEPSASQSSLARALSKTSVDTDDPPAKTDAKAKNRRSLAYWPLGVHEERDRKAWADRLVTLFIQRLDGDD